MWHLVTVVSIVGTMLLIIYLAGRRFVANQRALGRWDEYGPLEETEAPRKSFRGGGMDERLEVIGRWKGKVLRRRRPGEQP